ncbi:MULTISPECIES: nickel-responsive transcriptional regulator NikR [Dickeya]|uniref:nickel-responsive transcriptional regulator NikR n=1 Tax=Dickeya TaxID=204037 RepID=UPI000577CE5B|nr:MULTISPECIES: nickel-responsive transcriptional regulator NikR [Dickeya]MCL6406072.1 nickel-responsive transcriptional regulator NikR [Dickeya dadantii]NAT79531.1 nickel-responsive transcriptional regulator NikR [Dickeya dadantii]NPE54265.1 nickel-responsive transcriptional regulator NikR [Dickeya dadantii]NPE64940.1 nickel-responsive transcriptional regulator NikR [Dickeya dadantii]NPE67767.1 nickel-responsive transcriptional regulator NikR [Dickeya dadantii]
MQRLTISLDDPLAEALDALMLRKGYANRSEAFRDMLRRELGEMTVAQDKNAECVAVLSYVYDHHERQLSSRLAGMQHEHHHLTVSTMHTHLSHDECVETVILRGPTERVEQFAASVIAQTGVRHGRLNLIPMENAASGTEPVNHK